MMKPLSPKDTKSSLSSLQPQRPTSPILHTVPQRHGPWQLLMTFPQSSSTSRQSYQPLASGPERDSLSHPFSRTPQPGHPQLQYAGRAHPQEWFPIIHHFNPSSPPHYLSAFPSIPPSSGSFSLLFASGPLPQHQWLYGLLIFSLVHLLRFSEAVALCGISHPHGVFSMQAAKRD